MRRQSCVSLEEMAEQMKLKELGLKIANQSPSPLKLKLESRHLLFVRVVRAMARGVQRSHFSFATGAIRRAPRRM